MLCYVALIPCALSLDTRLILNRFQELNGSRYTVSNISEVSDGLKCALHFTEKYRGDWIDEWEKRIGKTSGVEIVGRELEKEHSLEIYSCGLIRVVLQNPDSKYLTSVEKELEFHYVALHQSICSAVQEVGYSILLSERDSIFYVCGIDANFKQLSTKFYQRLGDLANLVPVVLYWDVLDIERRLKSLRGRFGVFFLKVGFRELINLSSDAMTQEQLMILSLSLSKRISAYLSEPSPESISEVTSHIDLLPRIAGQANLLVEVYSDQVTTIGVYLTLLIFGMSISVSGITMPTDQIREISFFLSAVLTISGVLLWKRSPSKGIVEEGIKRVKKCIELYVMKSV